MPPALLWTLVGLGALAVLVRAGAATRQLRLGGGPVTPLDGALVVLGVAGLVAHCTAMFRAGALTWLAPARPYVDAVNALGGVSLVLFVAPAVLVVAGLRRAGMGWVTVLVLALIAVGITMYDHGSLRTHLTAITAAVVVIAAAVALRTPSAPPGGDVGRPGRRRGGPSPAAA